MPRHPTQYGGFQDEPDLLEELQALDWSHDPGLLIEEAASLIREAWSNPEPGEERSLDELLTTVPHEFQPEVLDAVLANDPATTEDTSSAQHVAETGLQWEVDQTRDALQYIEYICGEAYAHRLNQVIGHSRSLELRQLTGDPSTYYGNVHEQYIQCIADLPATVAAKEAMADTRWEEVRYREAVQHEVNRMAYRLNLEIQDRFLQQVSYGGRLARLASEQNMSEDIVELLATNGMTLAEWAEDRRAENNPAAEQIETAVTAYLLQIQLEQAIAQHDDATIEEILSDTIIAAEIQHAIDRAISDIGPETAATVRAALDIAAQCPTEVIMDGANDYHAVYAVLDFQYANQGREAWLADREDRHRRGVESGDCVTRALNEAGGGRSYGPIWEELTRRRQLHERDSDADIGVNPREYQETFLQYGMQPVLDAGDDLNNIMRKHLDLREIPTLMEHLFPDHDNPLTYIACTDTHAQAVVDGVLRDIRDRRHLGDQPAYRSESALTELWLKCDDPAVLEEARQIIVRYAAVRQYDEALTYGIKWRTTINQ